MAFVVRAPASSLNHGEVMAFTTKHVRAVYHSFCDIDTPWQIGNHKFFFFLKKEPIFWTIVRFSKKLPVIWCSVFTDYYDTNRTTEREPLEPLVLFSMRTQSRDKNHCVGCAESWTPAGPRIAPLFFFFSRYMSSPWIIITVHIEHTLLINQSLQLYYFIDMEGF